MNHMQKKKKGLFWLKVWQFVKYIFPAALMSPAGFKFMPQEWQNWQQLFAMFLCGYVICIILLFIDDREWYSKKIIDFKYD